MISLISHVTTVVAAECVPDRTDVQCLHRWQKVLNPDLVKGPWSIEVNILLGIFSQSIHRINMVLVHLTFVSPEISTVIQISTNYNEIHVSIFSQNPFNPGICVHEHMYKYIYIHASI